MTRKKLLEESIVRITKRAGLETAGRFHLTPVSQDTGGLFILEVMWSDRKRLCEEVKRAVTDFPSDTASGCIALLPDVVEQIILAAQLNPADLRTVSGRTMAGKARIDVQRTGDESLTQM